MGNKVGRTNIRGINFTDCLYDIIPTTVWYSRLIDLMKTMDENLFEEDDSNFSYYIGIDHGTNKCGVCLLREDYRQGLALEFAKRSNEDQSTYFDDLMLFLDELVEGRRVKAIIQETPPPVNRSKKTGYASIEKAAGAFAIIWDKIETKIDRNPKYAGIAHKHYAVPAWQSRVMDKEKYTPSYCKQIGIKDNKLVIANSICDKFPIMKNLLVSSAKSKSSDGFDAFGLCYAHSLMENGNVINGTRTTKRMISVYLPEERVKEYIDLVSIFIDNFETSFKLYRKNKLIPDGMTLYDAAKRSIVNQLTVSPVTNERQVVNLKWGLGLDLDYSGTIYVVTCHVSFYKEYIGAIQKNFLTAIY